MNSKEYVTRVEIRDGIITRRDRTKEKVITIETGQRFAVVNGLRYRLDEFNEYEWRIGAGHGHDSDK